MIILYQVPYFAVDLTFRCIRRSLQFLKEEREESVFLLSSSLRHYSQFNQRIAYFSQKKKTDLAVGHRHAAVTQPIYCEYLGAHTLVRDDKQKLMFLLFKDYCICSGIFDTIKQRKYFQIQTSDKNMATLIQILRILDNFGNLFLIYEHQLIAQKKWEENTQTDITRG